MRFENFWNNLRYSLVDSIKELPEEFELEVPFYAITETESLLTSNFFEKKLDYAELNDTKWRESGAKSLKLYYHWLDKLSAFASLKMVVAAISGNVYGTVNLATRSLSYGGFILDQETEAYEGPLQPRAYKMLIEREFHLQAEYGKVSLDRIKSELSQGHYVVAEVSELLRFAGKSKYEIPEDKRGSWVVIYGFNSVKKTIKFHNPTGVYKNSMKEVNLAEKIFGDYYSGIAYVIKGKKMAL